MKSFFKERKTGFYITLLAACLALIGSIVYLIVYQMTADPTTGAIDRVFSWLTFGLAIGGAVLSFIGEAARIRFIPIVVAICYSAALANHLVETAYPLADVLTKVPFFGGNPTLAIAFSIVFLIVAVAQVIASFMEHNKTNK